MFWLFRLPGMVYLCAAPLLLAGAVAVFVTDQQSETAKAIARGAQPPAPVKLEDFNPDRNIGQAQEAILVGQVDVAQAYELSITKSGKETGYFVLAPMYSTTATDAAKPATGVLLQEGRLDEDQIKSMAIGSGPIGPVLRIDGKILSASEVKGHDPEFRDHVRLAQNPVYIDPFEEGRAAGLAARSNGRDAAIAIAVFALIVAAWGFFKRRREQHIAEHGYI